MVFFYCFFFLSLSFLFPSSSFASQLRWFTFFCLNVVIYLFFFSAHINSHINLVSIKFNCKLNVTSHTIEYSQPHQFCSSQSFKSNSRLDMTLKRSDVRSHFSWHTHTTSNTCELASAVPIIIQRLTNKATKNAVHGILLTFDFLFERNEWQWFAWQRQLHRNKWKSHR